MKREDWNDGLCEIDPELVEDFIEQKAKYAKKSVRRPLIRAIIVAACMCVLVAAVIALPIALKYGGERRLNIPDESTGESDGVGSNGASVDETSVDKSDLPKLPIEYVSNWSTKTVDGQYYMTIGENYKVSANHNGDIKDFKGIKFYTVDDFKGTVENKKRKLSKQELDDIATFFDRDGQNIPIVDFNNLYVPDLDGSWTLLGEIIWWNGQDYEFFAVNASKNVKMSVRVMPMIDFDTLIAREQVSRSIIEGDKVISVVERASSTVLYVSQGQSFCVCTLDTANTPFDDAELKALGIRKNTAINILTLYWDGALGVKDIIGIELTAAIRKELSSMTETGEIAEKVSDAEIEIHQPTGYPSFIEGEPGTRWLTVDDVLYRISPRFDQICIVENIYSEGRVLTITENFKTLIRKAVSYHPSDCYTGTYENGTLTLDHLYDGLALVDVKVKEIVIGDDGEHYDTKNNKIVVELSAKVPCEYKINMDSQYSSDHLLDFSSQTVDIDIEPITVEIDFVGSASRPYYLYLIVGYTNLDIRIVP